MRTATGLLLLAACLFQSAAGKHEWVDSADRFELLSSASRLSPWHFPSSLWRYPGTQPSAASSLLESRSSSDDDSDEESENGGGGKKRKSFAASLRRKRLSLRKKGKGGGGTNEGTDEASDDSTDVEGSDSEGKGKKKKKVRFKKPIKSYITEGKAKGSAADGSEATQKRKPERGAPNKGTDDATQMEESDSEGEGKKKKSFKDSVKRFFKKGKPKAADGSEGEGGSTQKKKPEGGAPSKGTDDATEIEESDSEGEGKKKKSFKDSVKGVFKRGKAKGSAAHSSEVDADTEGGSSQKKTSKESKWSRFFKRKRTAVSENVEEEADSEAASKKAEGGRSGSLFKKKSKAKAESKKASAPLISRSPKLLLNATEEEINSMPLILPLPKKRRTQEAPDLPTGCMPVQLTKGFEEFAGHLPSVGVGCASREQTNTDPGLHELPPADNKANQIAKLKSATEMLSKAKQNTVLAGESDGRQAADQEEAPLASAHLTGGFKEKLPSSNMNKAPEALTA
ncbi:hypothetical protein Efla_003905 [Eimeria flavescens]